MSYDEMIRRAGTIKAGEPNFWDKVQYFMLKLDMTVSQGTACVPFLPLRVLYGVMDDAHITYTGWKYGPGYATHLDNRYVDSYKERITAGVNTTSLLFGGTQGAVESKIFTTGIGYYGEGGKMYLDQI